MIFKIISRAQFALQRYNNFCIYANLFAIFSHNSLFSCIYAIFFVPLHPILITNSMTTNMMFNFTPPHVANGGWISKVGNSQRIGGARLLCCALPFLCALLFSACTRGSQRQTNEAPQVEIPASIFFNPDSLVKYAELAYLHDDPKGLFVTGAAAYLRQQGEMPDSCTTVPLNEADIMLLHAAELGNVDALNLIRCLAAHGSWNHSIPETK